LSCCIRFAINHQWALSVESDVAPETELASTRATLKPICVWRTLMVRNGLRMAIVGALIAIGSLATARAAPIAPSAMTAAIGSPADFVSFWALPFPFGYAYRPGQCSMYVQEESPRGLVWRRVWICTEPGGRGYGEGGRF
jgi:hypothetical protein